MSRHVVAITDIPCNVMSLEDVLIFIATMISAHKCVLSCRNDMTCYVMYVLKL